LSSRGNPGSDGNFLMLTTLIGTETPTRSLRTSTSGQIGLIESTNTKAPTIEATYPPAPTSTNTPVINDDSCPEGIPQQFKVGDTVRVCTGQDRLILRNEPSPEGGEIFRMYPGVKLVLISGPRCGSQDTWWQVSVRAGSWVWDGHEFATTTEEIGWIREGGRDGDDYYICPEN